MAIYRYSFSHARSPPTTTRWQNASDCSTASFAMPKSVHRGMYGAPPHMSRTMARRPFLQPIHPGGAETTEGMWMNLRRDTFGMRLSGAGYHYATTGNLGSLFRAGILTNQFDTTHLRRRSIVTPVPT